MDRAQELHVQQVLIVDDDVGSILLLGQLLEGLGDIRFASGGKDALVRIRSAPPDLVLLDAQMPDMDGFAICAAVKEDSELADLPIIFVTAHADIDSEIRALQAGAVDFIHKPFNPLLVKARVHTHLALKRKSDELRRLTATDPLTGIANRRGFDEAFEREWRRAARRLAPLSLLLIDIDHFKSYNDLYGHLAGDDCLRRVAGALAASAQRTGDLVARFGGEEFAVLLPHTDAELATSLAEKLIRRIRDLDIPHAPTETGQLTISLGIACAQSPCREAKRTDDGSCAGGVRPEACRSGYLSLIGAADQALYAAKAAGRNQCRQVLINA